MARVVVLDPTASPPEDVVSPEPTIESLVGKVVGVRLDRIWRSFGWVADEWESRLVHTGASVRRWVAGNRVGDEGDRTRSELTVFADEVDAAVVGLGN